MTMIAIAIIQILLLIFGLYGCMITPYGSFPFFGSLFVVIINLFALTISVQYWILDKE